MIEDMEQFLSQFQNQINDDAVIQSAIQSYLIENDLYFAGKMLFSPSIDSVCVYADSYNNDPMLLICLPPISNYEIMETEHTRKYIHQRKSIAV